jgi:hypothetical protein
MRTPPFPMIEPMRMWGMSRRMGYDLDADVEGDSMSSWLSVRTMRPKA